MLAVQNPSPKRENTFKAPEYIPICPVHLCDMKSYRSLKMVTYFVCPKPGCKCSGKSMRKVFVARQDGNFTCDSKDQ